MENRAREPSTLKSSLGSKIRSLGEMATRCLGGKCFFSSGRHPKGKGVRLTYPNNLPTASIDQITTEKRPKGVHKLIHSPRRKVAAFTTATACSVVANNPSEPPLIGVFVTYLS